MDNTDLLSSNVIAFAYIYLLPARPGIEIETDAQAPSADKLPIVPAVGI
jgi:hypothetical protein